MSALPVGPYLRWERCQRCDNIFGRGELSADGSCAGCNGDDLDALPDAAPLPWERDEGLDDGDVYVAPSRFNAAALPPHTAGEPSARDLVAYFARATALTDHRRGFPLLTPADGEDFADVVDLILLKARVRDRSITTADAELRTLAADTYASARARPARDTSACVSSCAGCAVCSQGARPMRGGGA